MTDSEFLSWLRDRLVFVYDESPNVDFIWKLGEIISNMKHHEKCLECAEAIVREKLNDAIR